MALSRGRSWMSALTTETRSFALRGGEGVAVAVVLDGGEPGLLGGLGMHPSRVETSGFRLPHAHGAMASAVALPSSRMSFWITSSMKPYSLASSAVNQRSRSESASIRSTGWPVWNEMRSAIIRFR